MATLRRAFDLQRHNARRRGVAFLIMFEEWLGVWTASGHLPERGRGRGKYCMARRGDRGPYAVGNVKIIRYEENNREAAHPSGADNPIFGRHVTPGKRLTAAAVADARGGTAPREIPDGRGLYLCVQRSGHKSWVVRFRRLGGRPAKTTLGPLTKISLASARKMASEIIAARAH